MNMRLLITFYFFGIFSLLAQTKVSGYVFDEFNEPVSFANVIFKGSTQGTITDENGKCFLVCRLQRRTDGDEKKSKTATDFRLGVGCPP